MNKENEQADLCCPSCGSTSVSPSTLKGYLVCNCCGSMDASYRFITTEEMVKQMHKTGYVLNVNVEAVRFRDQFGMSEKRSLAILEHMQAFLVKRSAGKIALPIAAILKEAATLCYSPEELVCTTYLIMDFLQRAGYKTIHIDKN